jgi:hypothetical protein
VKARPKRLPGYIGVVYWGFFLVMLGYAALNSGPWWGLAFGAIWLGLAVACLWFYGVIPSNPAKDQERA